MDLKRRKNFSPHVVLVGAGASRAALPHGDPLGRKVPVLDDLVELVGLTSLLLEAGVDHAKNFEAVYDSLASRGDSDLLRRIEERVYKYFSALQLPAEATAYDRLIVSLRETDLIASFNWDPLLPLAYRRLAHVGPLPEIVFLHGNVSVGICRKDRIKGFKEDGCRVCGQALEPTRLLYPVRRKDYDIDPFIRNEWAVLRDRLREAYLLTIFGYRAPMTDKVAMAALRDSWQQNRSFDLAEIEIINIEPRRNIVKTWREFFCRDHFAISRTLSGSFLNRHPRRSGEAFAFASLQCAPWKDNFLPRYRSVERLLRWVQPLLTEEAQDAFTGDPCAPVPRRRGLRRG